ncbi:tetratricopeptide repeat protein [Marichromatium sp. AB32]|uniref:tetratricopeptide repeat protein n=1 Tax=Marichromatium sp. AB32 TaxID=2483363 RepID=UPI000F3F51C7|nr:tetratricopeptide repeat protein [Marichromatium sp. AB32]RNE93620.1 hypothetical protein EBL85_05850 [Marichromatium sp. AB32]
MSPTRALALFVVLLAPTASPAHSPGHVGVAVCAECHPAETARWRGSHHDLAMTEASEQTVLGDFADARIEAHGVTSRFFRRDGGFYVDTEGPDGAIHTYRIDYTFGWWPLQQYLIAFPGGRLQPLGIAWDARAPEDGGQRWFHLYPDTPLTPEHPLHWTSRDQTWNHQCAECHSTGLRKGYDLAEDHYHTTWSEIDVACEACHGAGATHVAEARAVAAGPGQWSATKGLHVDLRDRDGGHWVIDPEHGLPRRTVARTAQHELDTCARCHARRGLIHEDPTPGQPLGQTHRLALLEPGRYHPDGQILDEVFVHGSFIQSRMYRHGVTCSDCHDPHDLQPRAPGNAVCARCHTATRYDAPAHHHHPAGSSGAACVACHMPQRRYMVIDERADHSLRIPRPDLSRTLGTPNACNQCHQDRDPAWAEAALTRWYGTRPERASHFGEVLHAGRHDPRAAEPRLLRIAADRDQPAIARASALDLLRGAPDPRRELTLRRLLDDPAPLVRAAALDALAGADTATLRALALPRLDDPVRAVRMIAARRVAPLAATPRDAAEAQRLEQALDDYRATQLATAERPESHLNIGLLELDARRPEAAERAYRTALRLDPGFVPGYVNLADLQRALGRDAEAERTLRQGLAQRPEAATLHHALGLALIRQQRWPAAVEALGHAARLAPDNARHAYVLGLAQARAGEPETALATLRAAQRRHPKDRDLLVAIVDLARRHGEQQLALDYATKLQRLGPP